LEDIMQSVEAIKIAYAQALLVNVKELETARQHNDVVKAQEIFQNAYRTDVRCLVAEARLRAGGTLQPLEVFRQLKTRDNLIKERGLKTVASGL
ncbi:MAG: sugar isomerase, partial [Bacteroidota bacterium]|nr:sugar isomerase [Bacteroidota bacterium]